MSHHSSCSSTPCAPTSRSCDRQACAATPSAANTAAMDVGRSRRLRRPPSESQERRPENAPPPPPSSAGLPSPPCMLRISMCMLKLLAPVSTTSTSATARMRESTDCRRRRAAACCRAAWPRGLRHRGACGRQWPGVGQGLRRRPGRRRTGWAGRRGGAIERLPRAPSRLAAHPHDPNCAPAGQAGVGARIRPDLRGSPRCTHLWCPAARVGVPTASRRMSLSCCSAPISETVRSTLLAWSPLLDTPVLLSSGMASGREA